MTTTEKKAIIAQIRAENEHDYTYSRYDDEIETVYTYILDGSAPFPALTDPNSQWASFFFPLFSPINAWTAEDERLFEVIVHQNHWFNNQNWVSLGEAFVTWYIKNQVAELEPQGIEVMPFVLQIWEKHQLDKDELLKKIVDMQTSGWFAQPDKDYKEPLGKYPASSVGQYLLAAIRKDKSLMSLFKHYRPEKRAVFFELMVKNDPHFNDSDVDYFLEIDDSWSIGRISVSAVRVLLERDAKKYENAILTAMKLVEEVECMYYIQILLRQHLPEKYAHKTLEDAQKLILMTFWEINWHKQGVHNYEPKCIYNDATGKTDLFLVEKAMATLMAHDVAAAQAQVFDLYKKITYPKAKTAILKQLFAQYGDAMLPTLFDDNFNYHRHASYADDYATAFFKCLAQTDYSAYNDKVWAFLHEKEKQIVELAARALAKQGDAAVPNAAKLLEHKKADARQTGAFILSLISTPAAIHALMQKLNTEADDTTRDIMLETIKTMLPMQTEADMQAVIAEAKNRKKLDKPFEKWLIESEMPRLYWLSGAQLTDTETRFLFYRQTRSKDIRIDTEAKPMLALMDKTKSVPFAAALLKAFIDAGADTKAKYCLALATSLGSDAEIDVLKSKVLYWVDNSRGKMAEYAVKAIALNGGTKALRLIEFYARKYKSKYKNIGAAANEAFDLVAEELGIPPHDLADTIIPDFGFEGLFKEFEAGGETYRAYISNDFKIMFLDEDNKIIKTVPKAASAELKDDFKDTAKEIKDIVKSQTSRLEQYLVIQRQWSAEKWQNLFLQNPVMFVYAVRLVWAAYSTDNKLLYTFRCTEDQTLVNTDGDEIELDETANIAILHPIAADAATLSYWNNNLIDSDVVPPFAQLLRPVVLLDDADKNLKTSDKFKGVQYGGYGFLGRMEKTGWNKGSIEDGGMITSYYKDFSSLNITAVIEQTGTHCVGYYENNAEMGDLCFVKSNSVRFGSYYYDNPNATDSRLIAFGDVPAIVYSEVMADLQFFEENRVG